VWTLLDDFPLMHHNNVVRMPDCREPVCYNNSGNRAQVSSDLINSCLYFFLVLFIQSTSGFVQEKNLRFLDKGTGYGYPLLLPSRKLSTRIANICIDTIDTHFLINKIPGVSRFKSLNNVIISGVWVAIEKVFFD